MKNIILSAVVSLAFAQVASAASISITQTPAGGNTLFSLVLNADASEQFNGFGYSVVPNAPDVFQNVIDGGIADVETTEATFISAFLDAPEAFGGFGLSLAGKTNTPQQQSTDAGLLGGFIDASGGIFLGNVLLPAGGNGSYRVELQNTGDVVAELTGPLIIPEPTTMALAGLSMIGLVLRRRNG